MPLTSDAKRAFLSGNVNRTLIWLLTVFHESFGNQRFTSNTVPFVSRGNTFVPVPFLEVKKPPSQPGQIPAVELTIGVNDQAFVAALRAIDDSPLLTLEMVLAEDPDVVQDLTKNLTLEEAEMGVLVLRVFAGSFRLLQVLGPRLAYTPDVAPGVFV